MREGYLFLQGEEGFPEWEKITSKYMVGGHSQRINGTDRQFRQYELERRFRA